MPVMKAQINMRISANVNVSYAFERIVDTEEEVKEFGEQCSKMVDAYMNGYAREDEE